jgi:hypothetical protein
MLAAKLTEADLSRRVANGWSVTTKFAAVVKRKNKP